MAEALGAISSTITILDLAFKLRKCHDRIEAAPGVWGEYCDKVDSLSHVQSVLMDMISGQNHAIDRVKSEELATLADKEMQIIVKQANNILGACKDLARSPRQRVWDWLRVKRASVKFVIAEKGLQGLIDSVEKAKVSLQAAVCLFGLEKLNAGGLKLSKLSLVLVDKGEQPGKHLKRKRTSTKVSSHKSRRPRSSKKGRTSARHDHRRKKGSVKARDNGDHNVQAAGGYEIVLRDKKVLIMATDTDEYKSITRGVGTDAHTTGLIPVERNLEDMSDDEWERGIGNHLYEFQLSPPSTSVEDPESEEDSNRLDTHLSNDTMLIPVDSDKQSRAFVKEGTNLSQCDQGETKAMVFCVSRIRITETDQTFSFQEPCQQPCDHVAMQVFDARLTVRHLPYMMEIMFISGAVSSGETRGITLAPKFTLQSYHRCPDGWPCSHTLSGGDLPCQDDINAEGVVCLCSDSLRAWTSGYGWELDSPTKSPRAARDDDHSPLSLLQKVKRRDDTIPARIPFSLLVGYLKLIEVLRFEEEYLAQCCIWTDAILSEVSTSFDEEAIAWTWVLWKLQRGTEFKRLTGIIQQQGKHLIDQETNRYGVVPPQRIIKITPDTIDQKRISVLSQIRDLVQNTIETSRRNYMRARTQDDPGRTAPPNIISSSLVVGYFTLEHEMFLLDGRTWDDGNFDGVSFADASSWIRSMMNLRDWMVKPVLPASTMLSGLKALFSGGDDGLHEAGISSGLSSNVYDDLNDLIRRLGEEDDWGVDLPDE
ncbi:uncharacterized protein B0J16DRAFT_402390 [Fusarium flagelliforme]|uniref:uncharacterized protein n=1 Tax=Fusarium flagelliforme TaxID=2675880 RepID=UPI001E8ECDEE|nr:uncharacterized protein B0J16DRAFT_402390 [Fusarium flagelliforme]KAH7179039.1 hypothetical protein B0J16DRAFT_402390 [Fusarium flagelliforme]